MKDFSQQGKVTVGQTLFKNKTPNTTIQHQDVHQRPVKILCLVRYSGIIQRINQNTYSTQ